MAPKFFKLTVRCQEADRDAILRLQREMAEQHAGVEPSQSDVTLYLLRMGLAAALKQR